MKKLIMILLMSIGAVSAALPVNVGTNVARVFQYHNYCEPLSFFGESQLDAIIEGLGGVEEISTDIELLTEITTINEVFLAEGSKVGCATLKLLLKEIDLYTRFFE